MYIFVLLNIFLLCLRTAYRFFHELSLGSISRVQQKRSDAMSENNAPVASNENFFDEKASKLKAHLKREIRYGNGFFPRPFLIEFFGSPSAGKTTTITEIDKLFRRYGFRVWRPQEGAEVIRHIERDTPLYNIRTALYALTILVDQSVAHLYDIIIFDRCIFDAYCWFLYWQEKQLLTEEETMLFQSFFLSRFWKEHLDVAYMMTCSPEKAMERELRIALSKKQGETTNPKTIERLISRCHRAYSALSPTCPQLRMLDTTELEEQEMVQKVATEILLTLEKKVIK